jgi:hypothetical protein
VIPAGLERARVVRFLRRLAVAPRLVGLSEFVLALEAAGLIRAPGPRHHGAAVVELTTPGRELVRSLKPGNTGA